MDCVIKLDCWPTCVDCVAWSADSELAVALVDRVRILIPNIHLTTLEDARRRLDWHHCTLHTSLFNQDEWPRFQPRPGRVFSLGEEQSYSSVASLAWSPPGLGLHRRCAIGVLTTNFRLSIWASEKDPRVETSWKRVLLVNHALSVADTMSPYKVADKDKYDTAVLGERCRSFCWSPPLLANDPVPVGSRTKVKIALERFFLAVSTQLGDIAVLEVTSPAESVGKTDGSWSSRLVARHSISPGCSAPPPTGEITGAALLSKFPTHLVWSPFMSNVYTKAQHSSVIAFVLGQSLQILPCRLSLANGQVEVDFAETVKLDGEHKGPLKLFPGPTPDSSRLLACMSDHLVVYTLTMHDMVVHIEKAVKHEVDLTWDTVAGAGFTFDPSETQDRLNYATHTSYQGDSSSVIAWPPTGKLRRFHTRWADRLRDNKIAFTEEYKLGEEVLGRLWGLAPSPTGHAIAAVFSVHPAKQTHYLMRVEEESTLCVTSEVSRFRLADPPPIGALRMRQLSTESLMFALVKTAGEFELSFNVLQHLQWGEASRFITSIPAALREGNTANASIHFLRRQLDTQKALLDRTGQLLEDDEDEVEIEARHGIWRAFIEAEFDPEQLSRTERAILANFAAAEDLDDEDDEAMSPEAATDKGPDHVAETCIVCSEPIRLENRFWARCTNAHAYERCCLTLLAIQEPNAMRRCMLCERPALGVSYLKEQAHGNDPHELNGGVDSTETVGLGVIDQLLAAFESCVSCGGKYYG